MRAIVVSAAVIEDNDAFLLTRRAETAHLGGLWEFPGGKVEHGESIEDSLVRELQEELGCVGILGRPLLTTRHTYEDLHEELHFFEVSLVGTPTPRLGQEMEWVPRSALRALPLPEADAALVEMLTAGNE